MFYAQLDEKNVCECVLDTRFECDNEKTIRLKYFDTSYIGKKYEDGEWVEGTPSPDPVTEQEKIQAEILLNQCNLLINQENQDAVLAEILLNQMEV